MALQWIDSIASYAGVLSNSTANWSYDWGLGYYSLGASGGRFNDAYINAVSNVQLAVRRPVTSSSTIILGYAFYIAQTGSRTESVLMSFNLTSQSDVQCYVTYKFADGKFYFYRSGGALLGSTSGSVYTVGTWAYLEFKLFVDSTVGVFQAQVNGTQVFSYTGNTAGQTTYTIGQIQIGYNSGAPPYGIDGTIWRFNNVYCCDGTGSALNNFLGDCRIIPVVAAADTAQKNFTPDSGTNNYSRVGEFVADDDTSYVTSSTVGAKDLYTLGSIGYNPASLYAVSLSIRAAKKDAGIRTLRPVIKSGSTQGNGTTTYLGSGYGVQTALFTVDPATSAAWTPGALYTLSGGMEIVS